MTVEQKLAEWLEQTTPEPPIMLSVDDLRPRSRGRVWLPVLAAACVVLIVLVSVVIANRTSSNHSAPAVTAPPTTVTRTSASPRPSSPSATPARPTLPLLPASEWKARAIAPVSIELAPMAAAHGLLYALGAPGVVAMNTRGQVIARYKIAGAADSTAGPVIAGGLVWVAVAAKHSIHVYGLAEGTLVAQAEFNSVDVKGLDGATLSVAPDGRLLLAGGSVVDWLNPRTGEPAGHLQISTGPITGAAQPAAGGPIYVTTKSADTTSTVLRTVDPGTGAVLSSTTTPDDNAAVVAASAGGVWLTYGTGMMAYLAFAPLDNLTHSKSVGYGAGGISTSVWIAKKIAWVGGEQLACVNASTGQVLAAADVRYHTYAAAIDGVTTVGGHTYGLYIGDPGGDYLVELHPPAACKP